MKEKSIERKWESSPTWQDIRPRGLALTSECVADDRAPRQNGACVPVARSSGSSSSRSPP